MLLQLQVQLVEIKPKGTDTLPSYKNARPNLTSILMRHCSHSQLVRFLLSTVAATWVKPVEAYDSI